jgi:hypothetical protein
MSRIHLEFSGSDPSDCWVAADLLVREEPDEEEEEDEGTTRKMTTMTMTTRTTMAIRSERGIYFSG